MTKKTVSLTEAPVRSAMLRFALPFLAANVLHSLYGAVDLLIIGRFCASAVISAVSTGAQVMMTLQSLVIGLATGGTVLLGQSIGEGDDEKSARAVGNACVLFAVAALCLTPLMICFTPQILQWMKIPAEAEPAAGAYLSICAAGLPFVLGYSALSSVFRGSGNSRTPMVFVAVSSGVNLLADLLLVGGLGMGAAGAAAATAFSQLVSFLLAVFYIRRHGFPFPFRAAHFRPHRSLLGFILKIALPLTAQELLVNFSFLIILTLVNNMGVAMSASVGIVEKLLGFVMMPPMAFASAVTTMTAQNIGAKRPDRALLSLRWGCTYALAFGLTFCAAALAVPQFFTAIFSKEQEIIALAASYLRPYSTDCVLICVIFMMNSYFNGCGKSFISFAHSIAATFLIRVPLCRFSVRYCVGTLQPMGFAMPIASVFSLTVCCIYFFWLKKQGLGRELDTPPAA